MRSPKFAASSLLVTTAFLCTSAIAQGTCNKPVYLTFDTGHMGVAPLVAEVLKRQDVRVTFFAAAERTQTDGDSLDNHWAPWWKARAAEGHEFASHTYDHAVLARRPEGRRAALSASSRPRVPSQAVNSLGMRSSIAPTSPSPTSGCRTSPARSRFRCSAPRAARPRPSCSRLPRPVATRMSGGRRRASLATNCPARPSATRSCCSRLSTRSSPATSCWRTWESGRARIPGRLRISSR